MTFNFHLFAFICSVSGRGFNDGFQIGEKYFAHENDVILFLRNEHGYVSIEKAVKSGLADEAHASDVSEMNYIQHQGGPLLKISALFVDRLSFERVMNEVYYHEDLRPKAFKKISCPACGSTDVLKMAWGVMNDTYQRYDYDDTDLVDTDYCNSCDCSITLINHT